MTPQDLNLTLRIPSALAARADALIPLIAEDSDTSARIGRLSRSAVMRLALIEGLKVLERKYGR